MMKRSTLIFVVVIFAIGIVVGWQKAGSREALRPQNDKRERDAIIAIEARAKEFRKTTLALLRRQLAGEEISQEHLRYMDDFLTEVEAAGDQISGREAKGLKAAVLLLRDLKPAFENYHFALQAFSALGPLVPDRVKDKVALAARREATIRVIEANDGLDTAFAGIPASLEKRIVEAGVSKADAEIMTKNIVPTANLDIVAQIRQCDRDCFNAYLLQVQMLDDHFGQWKAAAGNVFDFQSDTLNSQFGKHFEAMENAAKKQEQIQRQLLTKVADTPAR